MKNYGADCAPNLQDAKIPTVFVADLLSLTLLKPPGELGADIVIGNSQVHFALALLCAVS